MAVTLKEFEIFLGFQFFIIRTKIILENWNLLLQSFFGLEFLEEEMKTLEISRNQYEVSWRDTEKFQ